MPAAMCPMDPPDRDKQRAIGGIIPALVVRDSHWHAQPRAGHPSTEGRGNFRTWIRGRRCHWDGRCAIPFESRYCAGFRTGYTGHNTPPERRPSYRPLPLQLICELTTRRTHQIASHSAGSDHGCRPFLGVERRQPTVNFRSPVARASNGRAMRAFNANSGLRDCGAPTGSAARRSRPIPVR
jgi:hypothetical protein